MPIEEGFEPLAPTAAATRAPLLAPSSASAAAVRGFTGRIAVVASVARVADRGVSGLGQGAPVSAVARAAPAFAARFDVRAAAVDGGLAVGIHAAVQRSPFGAAVARSRRIDRRVGVRPSIGDDCAVVVAWR